MEHGKKWKKTRPSDEMIYDTDMISDGGFSELLQNSGRTKISPPLSHLASILQYAQNCARKVHKLKARHSECNFRGALISHVISLLGCNHLDDRAEVYGARGQRWEACGCIAILAVLAALSRRHFSDATRAAHGVNRTTTSIP